MVATFTDDQLLEVDDYTEYTLDDIDARLDILMASLNTICQGEFDQNLYQSILWD